MKQSQTGWHILVLVCIHSLQPDKGSVPGYLVQAGIAHVLSPVHAQVKGYGGNDLNEGELIPIYQWDMIIKTTKQPGKTFPFMILSVLFICLIYDFLLYRK